MTEKILSIGNFTLSDVYNDDELVLQDFPGGMNFRVVSACAYLGQPADYVTAIGSEGKWVRFQKMLNSHQVRAAHIISLPESIKFIWRYHQGSLKDLEATHFDHMNKIAQIEIPQIQSYQFINLCALGYTNELKILNRLNSDRQKIAYVFHDSNFQLGSASDYLGLLDKICYLFLNADEACTLTGLNEVKKAGKKLSKKAKYCFVTLAEQGLLVFHDGRLLFHQPALNMKVLDVSGAGDTFAGATLASLIKGNNLRTACRLGLTLAGISITDYLNKKIVEPLL